MIFGTYWIAECDGKPVAAARTFDALGELRFPCGGDLDLIEVDEADYSFVRGQMPAALRQTVDALDAQVIARGGE